MTCTAEESIMGVSETDLIESAVTESLDSDSSPVSSEIVDAVGISVV